METAEFKGGYGVQQVCAYPGKRRIGRMVLGVVFLIGSSSGTWQGGAAILTWANSGNWQAIPAEVTISEVDDALWETRQSASGRVVRSQTRYKPTVRYQYQIHGDTFVSERIKFGEELMGADRDKDDWMSSKEPAQQIVSRYPEGSTMTVYVNPHDPQQAVIERNIDLSTWRALTLALLCSFIGLRLFTAGVLRDAAVAQARVWLFRRSPCRWDLLIVAVLFAIVCVVRALGHSF